MKVVASVFGKSIQEVTEEALTEYLERVRPQVESQWALKMRGTPSPSAPEPTAEETPSDA